jgi:formylmethanofuran dehydrogenase subunit B
MQINKRNNGWCFRADFLTRRLGIFLTVSESDASADISPEKVHSLLQENNMGDFSLEAIELAVASSQATLSNMSEVCNLLKAFNRTVRGFVVKIGPVNTGTSSLNYFDLPG